MSDERICPLCETSIDEGGSIELYFGNWAHCVCVVEEQRIQLRHSEQDWMFDQED